VSEPLPRGRPGDWAELSLVVIEPAGRAPGLPEDTAATPLVARVRGFLETEAVVGEPAAVRTLAARRVEGTLRRLHPAPGHSFGEPVAELLAIGGELRARLAEPAGG
jgi:2-amino-4-ketopentanoate thiolase alpha subunit